MWSSLGSTSMRRAPAGPTSARDGDVPQCGCITGSAGHAVMYSMTSHARRRRRIAVIDRRDAEHERRVHDVDLAPRADVHTGERRADGHERDLARRRRHASHARAPPPARPPNARRPRSLAPTAAPRRACATGRRRARAPRGRPSPTAPTRRRRSRRPAWRAAAPPGRPTPSRSRAGPARARRAARCPASAPAVACARRRRRRRSGSAGSPAPRSRPRADDEQHGETHRGRAHQNSARIPNDGMIGSPVSDAAPREIVIRLIQFHVRIIRRCW